MQPLHGTAASGLMAATSPATGLGAGQRTWSGWLRGRLGTGADQRTWPGWLRLRPGTGCGNCDSVGVSACARLCAFVANGRRLRWTLLAATNAAS